MEWAFGTGSRQTRTGITGAQRTLCGAAVVILAAIILSLALASPAAAAPPETMSIDKVQTGMIGYAKTVTTGTVIATFTVEVVSVLSNENYPSGDLILFRASGPIIDQTGGVVAGMSGSPIYLTDPADGHDKIVGAVSYGMDLNDATLALATPIDEMLSLTSLTGMSALPAQTSAARYVPPDGGVVDLGGGRFLSAAVASEGPTQSLPPGTAKLQRLAPVISVMGMSSLSRGFTKLNAAFQTKGFKTVAVPGSMRVGVDLSGATIEPGASLGAALMTGDATVAAIGAVTYVDGTRVIGFGHPMLWQGDTNLPMTTGYVHAVWPSILGGYGFKMASAGETTGTIVQDRAKGIGGRLGQAPATTPLVARSENASESTATTQTYYLAKGVMSNSFFATVIADSALIRTNDMVFENMMGTADTTFTISGTTASGESFSLDYNDMVFDQDYVSASAAMQFDEALWMLIDNGVEDVSITGISYSANIVPVRRTARVVNASLLGRPIRPGTTMTVRVYVVPYNSHTAQAVDTTIAIPKTFPKMATLSVETADWYAEGYYGPYAGPSLTTQQPSVSDIVASYEGQLRSNALEVKITKQQESDYMYGLPPTPVAKDSSMTNRVSTNWVESGQLMKDTAAISMRASATSVTYPGGVRFSGTLVGNFTTRPRIELWMKPRGSTEGTVVASRSATLVRSWWAPSYARYSLSYAPTTTAAFWARFVGDDDYLDANSSSRSVGVRARVSLLAARSRIRRGQIDVLSGLVRPAHSSDVYIQRLVGRRWLTLKKTALVAGSRYSYNWKPTRAGTYVLRTWWHGDGSHISNVSSVRTVRVI